MLERSAVDDGHAPSRHRVAPLRSAQGCLQTRAPTALLSTAMQPAPSASSMPALTGATVDAVERGHAASPCLQGLVATCARALRLSGRERSALR